MARRNFVVVYGMPASGKTTLCRHMADRHHFYYSDVANAAERGGPMWRIAAEQYEQHGRGLALITEGVFLRRDHRDRFCSNILRGYRNFFVAPTIFHLRESRELLVDRRSGWERRFGELEHEVGSEKFEHHDLDGVVHDTLEKRAQFILDVLAARGAAT